MACCIVLAMARSWTEDPVATIQSMLAKPKTLCGQFNQSKQLTGLKKPVVSTGRFCVVANKGVLWRTVRPFPSTLRLTREEIAHLQGDRVVSRLEATQEPTLRMINSVLFALLAGDLDSIKTFFEVDGKVLDNQWSVTLRAREPALAKILSSVALDGGAHITGITINEMSGDRTSIVFSKIETGAGAMSVDEAALF
jgi:hypothetical protein